MDLGTTYSAVALVDENGKANLIPDSASNRLTPSVLLFEDDGTVTVGHIAKQNAVANPTRVVEFVKREMGHTREEFSRTFAGETYDAAQLSSLILKKLKEEAQLVLGRPVTQAVITVPAYFNDSQRAETIRAGELAQLKVLRLVDEPVAAAVAFGVDEKSPDGRVLVFDLGGGTLDVTVLEKTGARLKIIATDGDHQLGGKDWDDCLIQYAARQFEEKFSLNPLGEPAGYQDLQLRSIQVKETLSQRDHCPLVVQHRGHLMTLEITRQLFQEMTNNLVSRCEFICGSVLKQGKCEWKDIDLVLLVGGSTKMPAVREMIRGISGREGQVLVHADEAVALGAAYVARLLDTAAPRPIGPGAGVQLSECAAHSLGTVTKESDAKGAPDHLSIIIPRGQRIGIPYRENYATLHAGQTSALFKIMEGETLESAAALGECILSGLPPGRSAGRPLWLELTYDSSHVLKATGCDIETNKQLTVEIRRTLDLDPDSRRLAQDAIAALPVR
jgi:molecular chaperone DnaK